MEGLREGGGGLGIEREKEGVGGTVLLVVAQSQNAVAEISGF